MTDLVVRDRERIRYYTAYVGFVVSSRILNQLHI